MSPWVSIGSGMIVLLICLAGTIVLGFTTLGSGFIDPEKRPWMALLLGAYGLFRAIRIALTIKKLNKS
ncbi:MAG: hypothetical protein N3F09_01630 [Bacteroidia bacterium]|nr:hypothetical protein [Bacteroidia bacterium]